MARVMKVTDNLIDYLNRLQNMPEDALETAIKVIRLSSEYDELVDDETFARYMAAGGNEIDVESLEEDTSDTLIVVSDLLVTILAAKREN